MSADLEALRCELVSRVAIVRERLARIARKRSDDPVLRLVVAAFDDELALLAAGVEHVVALEATCALLGLLALAFGDADSVDADDIERVVDGKLVPLLRVDREVN